jgi:SAM-dependent methyltransferase
MTPDRICPVCGGADFEKLLAAGRIHREAVYRERFVLERFNRKPAKSELKDLTDFAHAGDTSILTCAGCGLLLRDESLSAIHRAYREDAYDEALVDLLFPRYLAAFREKAPVYRGLLPQGANVLEVGSHYGAFLGVAAEWGWQAAGVDIGKDTSRYAKSKGYLVFNKELEECSFPDKAFDGVFVWNCFEQVPEPRPLLREIHRIVKPGGLLVVRTPNAVFYEMCETRLRHSDGDRDFALKAMAYNNLLAFPYLFGYGRAQLEKLASSERFRLEGAVDSELLTLPLPVVPRWVEEEQRSISAGLDRMNRVGPWIELYYRAA